MASVLMKHLVKWTISNRGTLEGYRSEVGECFEEFVQL